MGLFDYDYSKLAKMSISEQRAYKRRIDADKLLIEELEGRRREQSLSDSLTEWEEWDQNTSEGAKMVSIILTLVGLFALGAFALWYIYALITDSH